MKKFIVLTFLLLSSKFSFGQNFYPLGFSNYSITYNIENNNPTEEKNITQYRIENKIKEKTTVTILKNGKIDKDSSIETYNKAGRIVSIKSKNYQFFANYLYDTVLSSTKSIFKKDTSESVYEYDLKGLLKNYKTIKKGKIISEVIITKNTAGKTTNRMYRYGHKLNKSSEMKYYYDINNILSKSERYLNSKLKNVWNYDCKTEGEIIINKKINEKSVCKWTEDISNGNYIIYNRTTDKKKTYLHKSYYTKDSVFYKSEQFLNDTIKVYEFEKTTFQSISKTYSKKGNLRFENIQLFTDSKLLKSNYYINYKMLKTNLSERNYFFNNHNLICKSNFYRNKKMKFQTKYEYTFFN